MAKSGVAKLPTKCIVCGVRLNTKNRASRTQGAIGVDDMCDRDYVRSGLDNEHADSGHDLPVENCPTCEAEVAELKESPVELPEPDETHDLGDFTRTHPANPTRRSVKPPARRYIDHKGHNHPLTPKARAACRAAGGRGIPDTEPEPVEVIKSANGSVWHLMIKGGKTACTDTKPRNARVSTTATDAVTCPKCLKLG